MVEVRIAEAEKRITAIEVDLKKIRSSLHAVRNASMKTTGEVKTVKEEMTVVKDDVTTLKGVVADAKSIVERVEHNTAVIINVLGSAKDGWGIIRKHGPRAIAAVMGASIYAGFIDANNPIARFIHSLFG